MGLFLFSSERFNLLYSDQRLEQPGEVTAILLNLPPRYNEIITTRIAVEGGGG